MSKPRLRIFGTRDRPRRVLTAPARPKLEPELERLLLNWALWSAGGLTISRFAAYSSMAGFEGHGTRDSVSMPVIAADAERVNRAVDALTAELHNALVIWWIQGGSLRHKAKRAGCRPEKLLELVDTAHARLRSILLTA